MPGSGCDRPRSYGPHDRHDRRHWPDTAQTPADIALANEADRVALPSSILRLQSDVRARLQHLATVTVVMPQFQALSAVG